MGRFLPAAETSFPCTALQLGDFVVFFFLGKWPLDIGLKDNGAFWSSAENLQDAVAFRGPRELTWSQAPSVRGNKYTRRYRSIKLVLLQRRHARLALYV